MPIWSPSVATSADGGGTYLCWCLIRVSKHAPRWVFISLTAFFCCCRIIPYRKPLQMLFLYVCVLVQCEGELLRSAPRSQEPNLTRPCSLWRKQAVRKAEGIIRQHDGVLFRQIFSGTLRPALFCTTTTNKSLCKLVSSFCYQATKRGVANLRILGLNKLVCTTVRFS